MVSIVWALSVAEIPARNNKMADNLL